MTQAAARMLLLAHVGNADSSRGPRAERDGAGAQPYGHAPWMRRLCLSKKVRVPQQ